MGPMRRNTLQQAIVFALASLPFAARGQAELTFTPPTLTDANSPTNAPVELGGRTSFDLIRLSEGSFSIPLRNGNLRKGSEVVELEGQTLRRGTDYTIDYASGAVYLLTAYRPGQSLRVQYRYDPSGTAGTFGVGGSPAVMGFGLNFMQGSEFLLGMGLTERLGDGTLLTSNLYGLKTNFQNSAFNLNGLLLISERKRTDSVSLLGDGGAGRKDVDEGQSTAMVQNLQAPVLGGQLEATYQDIGSNFAGFQGFAQAGMDGGQVEALQKEKGLKRSSFSLKDLGLGAFRFSSSQRTVGDDKGAINWRTYGLNAGALQLNWTGQRVDQGFNRFGDIREGDRDQLAKERGLDRQTLDGAYAVGTLSSKFSQLSVDAGDGALLSRSAFNFAVPWLKLDWSAQSVASEFTRFGDLREGDRDQLSRERGLAREALALDFGQWGLKLSDSRVRGDSGDFRALDATLNKGRLSFEYASRKADEGFASMGNLRGDEHQTTAAALVRMLDPGRQVRGDDVQFVPMSQGLGRSFWRLGYDLGKGSSLRLDDYTLTNPDDQGRMQSVLFNSPRTRFSFRSMDLGAGLNPSFGRLLPSEREVLGWAAGVKRTDLDFATQFGQNRSLQVSQLSASHENGDLTRQQASLRQPGLEIDYVRRAVDPGFTMAAGIAHAEKDLFASLIGYDQTEMGLRWTGMRGINLDHFSSRSDQSDGDLSRGVNRTIFAWDLDSKTKLNWMQVLEFSRQEGDPLNDRRYSRYSLSRDFGKLGQLAVSQEQRTFVGSQTNEPDGVRNTVSYQAQVNKTTTVRTEQSRMDLADGRSETVNSNTIATQLTPRAGVSVTNTQIERDGDDSDETKRNYGFWYDFGKGIRLNYNYVRDMTGQAGTQTQDVSVTPGQVGDLKIDSATYQRKSWDETNDQHFGNVNFGTAKPLDLGFLRGFEFRVAADTARDRYVFTKENRHSWVGGNLFGLAMRYDYISQIAPNGYRAIDRVYRVTTDQSESRPLRANFEYKVRTLPWDDEVMIRRFNVVAKPSPSWLITHSVEANPDAARGDVLLGTVPEDVRRNAWKIDFVGNAKLKSGFEWNETRIDGRDSLLRQGKLNFTFFADNPSPLYFSYGVNQWDNNGDRSTEHGFTLQYDQRPGPNQSLSMFLSNLHYEHSTPQGRKPSTWNMRFEYSLRF